GAEVVDCGVDDEVVGFLRLSCDQALERRHHFLPALRLPSQLAQAVDGFEAKIEREPLPVDVGGDFLEQRKAVYIAKPAEHARRLDTHLGQRLRVAQDGADRVGLDAVLGTQLSQSLDDPAEKRMVLKQVAMLK